MDGYMALARSLTAAGKRDEAEGIYKYLSDEAGFTSSHEW
jgi:hypothetical protein